MLHQLLPNIPPRKRFTRVVVYSYRKSRRAAGEAESFPSFMTEMAGKTDLSKQSRSHVLSLKFSDYQKRLFTGNKRKSEKIPLGGPSRTKPNTINPDLVESDKSLDNRGRSIISSDLRLRSDRSLSCCHDFYDELGESAAGRPRRRSQISEWGLIKKWRTNETHRARVGLVAKW